MSAPHSTESSTLNRPGGWLDYSVAGAGDPVIFIHGFGLDAGMWDAQWPAFTERHRSIRYDLRGYGRSSMPDGAYSHVDDLLALMDALDARPAHLVGLSMGGRFALRVAKAVPDAVRSLTLVDTALDGHLWSGDWLRRWRGMSEAAKRGDVPGAKQLWLEHPLFEPALRHPAIATALETMVQQYSGWHWQHKDLDQVPVPPSAEVLATIATPTLVIVGQHDLPDFQAIAQRVAVEMPHATLRSIARAGHMANMEAPQAFNEWVLQHLQRHSALAPLNAQTDTRAPVR